jgi:hypothetical protein
MRAVPASTSAPREPHGLGAAIAARRGADRGAIRARCGLALAMWPALALCAVAVGSACGQEPVAPVVVELRLAPASLDFGALPLGARARRLVAITNDGNGPWRTETEPALRGDSTAFAITRPCALPLAPGAFCEMEIAFAPQAEGALAGSLVVVGPDGAELVVALAGRGDPADVVLAPAALTFGAVDVGGAERRSFTITSRAAEVLEVPLVLRGDGFFVGAGTRRELQLQPGEQLSIAVDFSPSRGGPATGEAILELCGAGCGPAVQLDGVGLAPRIEVQPRIVDLGEVARGDEALFELVIANAGLGDLVVTRLDLFTTTPDLSLTGALDGEELPFIVPDGERARIELRYAPATSRAALDATLRIRSNDPVSPEVFVPIDGATPGPALEILPRVAHFGVLDLGQERRLDVVVRSTGTVPADVRELRLDGAGFSFDPAPSAMRLLPYESIVFGVRARATATTVAAGGSTGTITARAVGLDDVEAPLAFLSGTSGCQPRALVPNVLLGSVLIGRSVRGAVLVENIGDGPCSLLSAREAPGLPFDLGFSFSAVAALEILPGESAPIEFAFRAIELGQRSAFLSLTFAEQPAPLFVSATARGVSGVLVADPPAIIIGPIVEGCPTNSRLASFVNRGAEVLSITSLRVSPPGAPFSVVFPSVPRTVAPGALVSMPVDANRAAPGIHEAAILASTDGDLDAQVRLQLIVEPQGEPITEVFEASAFPRVDVLFVVDNSGSMADDQARLAANFDRFIAAGFGNRNMSFHIGVTTTDVIGGSGGPLVGGFLTDRTTGLADRFAQQALVGTGGLGIELGLEAMRRALDSAETRNAGFLRADAALSVVIVSDEEDNGDRAELDNIDPSLRRPVDFYIEALRALKGGNLESTPVLVSAVVSPSASARYRAVADAFGGVVLDIGTTTWGEELSAVGDATFGLRRLFRTGSEPVPGTVTVTVNGTPITAFTVDVERRTVTLRDEPPANAVVTITYVGGCS